MRSNSEWKAWGEIDPLYGVAKLRGKSKKGCSPWTDEVFFQTGARDWNSFRPHWERYGVTLGSCLEIGCGAGRMTRQLAHYFPTVHGVDVSAGMIEYARRFVDSARVHLHVTEGLDLPLPDNSISAVFSTHVFQHFDSRSEAARCFAQIYRVMDRNSTLMIHLPIIAWPWGPLLRAHELIDALKTHLTGLATTLQRFAYARGFRKQPPMRVIWYEVNWLNNTLSALGFKDIEVHVVFEESPMAVQHPFLFARKP